MSERKVLTMDEVRSLFADPKLWLNTERARADFDAALARHDAEKRAEWEAEQGWEYVPGWIADDGRARISQGVVAPGYVGEFIAGGGDVVRRRVSRFETVTADMMPVEHTRAILSRYKTTKTEKEPR